jgi:DNA-binding response OmpR family regulator
MQDPRSANSILIVEDERNIAALVETYLAQAGFEPIVAHDGSTGLELLRQRQPGFVILDLMLPGVDGWDLCREIRKTSDVPILILTAREEELDRVLGFSLGADDYVVKPFSPRELVERVKAILRRTRPAVPAADARLQHGPLVLEPDKHKVTLDGRSIPLTPSEYTLLHSLMSAPGRVFSRDALLGHLYRHGEAVVDRVIDVHIGKLRQKIEADPSEPRFILTVRGVGYRFAESGEI